MKKRTFIRILVGLCLVAIGALSWHSTACAADKATIEAAKKEGKFVWYTSMPMDPSVSYLNAFKKKYPFLDTSEFWRSNSYKVYSRINTETGAKKYIVDCAHVAIVPAFQEWKEKGWLMKYESPIYSGYPKETIDRGYWAPFRTVGLIMAYSTTTVSPKEAPATWSDLTNPKWKGLIGIEPAESGSQHIQWFILRRELGQEFLNKLAANKPRVYSGSGAIMNGLLRGEIKVAMLSYAYKVYDFRELKGAPIKGIWATEGVTINLVPQAIMANAPHPNAAKLFMDWSLSQEGQAEMVKLVGAYSGRSDVPTAKGNLKLGDFKKLYMDYSKLAASRPAFKKWMDSVAK